MEYIRVLAFDLSGATVGVVGANVSKGTKQVFAIRPCHIIPNKLDPSTLGYKRSKKKVPTKENGTAFVNSYIIDGETHVPAAEKKRRDVEVRNANNDYIKRQISEQISHIISGVSPNIILVEKNSIFNGILTSVLLGEIMGLLEGICGVYGIQLVKIKVDVARAPYNISEVVKNFAREMSAEDLLSMEDVAKHAIQKLMKDKYDIEFVVLDESDACLIFDYWLNHIYKGEQL